MQLSNLEYFWADLRCVLLYYVQRLALGTQERIIIEKIFCDFFPAVNCELWRPLDIQLLQSFPIFAENYEPLQTKLIAY